MRLIGLGVALVVAGVIAIACDSFQGSAEGTSPADGGGSAGTQPDGAPIAPSDAAPTVDGAVDIDAGGDCTLGISDAFALPTDLDGTWQLVTTAPPGKATVDDIAWTSPKSKALHATATTTSGNNGYAYQKKAVGDLASLKRATLDYDFGYDHIGGYGEVGCLLTYGADDGDDSNNVDIEIRAPESANTAGFSVAVVDKGSGAAPPSVKSLSDPVAAATALLARNMEFHHIRTTLTALGDAYSFAFAVDQNAMADLTIVPSQSTKGTVVRNFVQLSCGIHDIEQGSAQAPKKDADVAVKNVQLTLCK